MESAQKRERDRKNRQRRQDKEDRRKDRARQKLERLTHPEPAPGSPEAGIASADSAPPVSAV